MRLMRDLEPDFTNPFTDKGGDVLSRCSTGFQPASIAWSRCRLRRFWSAVAERSGDTAFRRAAQAAKAAWRFASRRTPKSLVAALPRCAVSLTSSQQTVRASRRVRIGNLRHSRREVCATGLALVTGFFIRERMQETGRLALLALFIGLPFLVCRAQETNAGDAAAATPTSPPAAAASAAPRTGLGDALVFRNGDRLFGTLQSIDPQNGIRWQRPDVAQRIDLGFAGVAEIQLSERPEPKTGVVRTCEIRLVNGDVLAGNLISCDAEKAVLETWYAGQIQLPRQRLRLIRPLPPSLPAIYTGPAGLEGWTLGKIANPAAGEPGQWTCKNEAFYATRSASIARDLKLPDVASLQFGLAWKGYFYLAIALYTDSLQPVNLATKENEPDFGGFYSLQINSFSANLVPITKQDPLRYLGQAPIAAFQRKNTAHVDVRVNKAKRTLALFVDGALIKEWVDGERFIGEGTGVRFVHQGQGAVKLSQLQVLEWDGQYEEKTPPAAGGKLDVAKLRNGDKVSGRLESILEDKATLALSGSKLDIPISRVKQIEFAAQPAGQTVAAAREIKGFFRPGGAVTFQLEEWSEQGVVASSPNFGRITLNPAAFTRIVFSPGLGQ